MILNIRSIYVILYLCNRTESGCDFPIVRCPLVLQRRVMPMNTMEVLTLLLVVFAALSYIDRHGDDNNKKKSWLNLLLLIFSGINKQAP